MGEKLLTHSISHVLVVAFIAGSPVLLVATPFEVAAFVTVGDVGKIAEFVVCVSV